MKIIDLNGNEIIITNLQLAVMQADDYRHYEFTSTEKTEFYRKQKDYWEDFYHKVIRLSEENAYYLS